MSRLIWSDAALRDLRRLHDFLAPKNPAAAIRAIKTIRQGIHTLAKLPESGRPVEDMLDGFRELVIGFGQSAYVVLYNYDREQAVILAIRHGREAGY